MDFSLYPFIAFWEITRACALSCLHCRATAQLRRHPQELTTAEGRHLIDQIADLGHPLFVITGGDPMMRRDLYEFIRYGTEQGLRVSLAPSATPLLTVDSLRRAKEVGCARVSISLDGSTAAVHDAFRQTPGAYQRTLAALAAAAEAGVSVQINSTVSRYNKADLPRLVERVAEFKPATWSVFFLVPTGRGKAEDMVSPEEHEEIFNWLYDTAKRVPFDIKTTAAEHYRRVIVQRKRAEAASGPRPAGLVKLEFTAPDFQSGDSIGRAPKGVNDGNGCLFVSHIGEVSPSGFLPLVGGNVREQPLAEIYRNSSLFRDLRDTAKLKGKCGVCEYNTICGGSRARAYAVTGDYLAAEPYCVYQPVALAPARR
ncbi:MAG: TIGR04053 family radical SAM/SPASM domain-containing protein [Chloroflexi bacterium]|nr:TIGR04053 family radical SAM/SPASM domain-containing protein [Chloroflexota bacterium]